MAICKGLLGPVSGKVGNMVFSTWRGRQYVKSLPKPSVKPPSQKQLEHQAKFALAVRFLKGVSGIVRDSLNQPGKVASGINVAVKHVLKHCIRGESSAYRIDYEKVMLSQGPVARPACVGARVEGTLLVTEWMTSAGVTNGRADDLLTLLVYLAADNTFLKGPDTVQRRAGLACMTIPEKYRNQPLHVYMFFEGRNGKKFSDTVYVGVGAARGRQEVIAPVHLVPTRT